MAHHAHQGGLPYEPCQGCRLVLVVGHEQNALRVVEASVEACLWTCPQHMSVDLGVAA